MGTGVTISDVLRFCDTLWFREDSSTVKDVPGRPVADAGGDSGICISLEDSLLLNGVNGLRCFFSDLLSWLPGDCPTTLFRRFMTVPRRLKPPRGVCRGWGSGAAIGERYVSSQIVRFIDNSNHSPGGVCAAVNLSDLSDR